MPQHRNALMLRRGEPVELNDFPLANERLVPMPGIIGAAEGQQGLIRGPKSARFAAQSQFRIFQFLFLQR